MHVRTRVGEAGAEDASLSEDHVSERVTDIIKQCLNAHGGSFDHSQIKHKNLGLSPSDERMYSRVNKLLQPGQLREFVEGHGGWSSLGPMPRRLPLRRQALPVPRQQQQQQQQHKQAVVQNQGRAPDLGNCPHLQ